MIRVKIKVIGYLYVGLENLMFKDVTKGATGGPPSEA